LFFIQNTTKISLGQRALFSTTFVPWRRNTPVSRIEEHDPSTYKTLAFYQFHPIQMDLNVFRDKLLTDLGELGVVGRIYIAKEGMNAQIACPEENLTQLKQYHHAVLKPLFDNRLMEFNIGTEHGMRSFRALHVRIRKQVNWKHEKKILRCVTLQRLARCRWPGPSILRFKQDCFSFNAPGMA
jgi:hypothetical protein